MTKEGVVLSPVPTTTAGGQHTYWGVDANRRWTLASRETATNRL